jgi:AcrR family transcriptional regulator
MTTRMKGHERRAAIVRSASRMFAEKGFRGTTTRELAAALGVTEPVLYQHFHTKKDLYQAIIDVKLEEAAQDAADFLTHAQGDDDRAFFAALGGLILSRFEKDPELSRLLLYSALENPELGELFFDRAIADFHRIVAEYVDRRARAGAFREVQPEIVARAAIGMFHHHGLIRLLYPDRVKKVSHKKVLDEVVDLALNGLLARGGRP